MGMCRKSDIFEVTIERKRKIFSIDKDKLSEDYELIEKLVRETKEEIANKVAGLLNGVEVEGKLISCLNTSEVKIVCGDSQILEARINELLPEWQMDGPVFASGNMFYQKMVKLT